MKRTKKEKTKKEKKPVNMKRRIVVLCVALAVIALLVRMAGGMFSGEYDAPQVTGSLNVQTALYTWTDESREETFKSDGSKRSVTVKMFYPEEEGSYPLVVFSHGAFGVIDSNYSTCMELASNGYVVASIAHPYHAMFVEDAQGKVTIVNMDFFMKSLNSAEMTEQEAYDFSCGFMQVRTGDMQFVLDTILGKAAEGEAPFAMIDAEHIGLFGHSMGGATSVHVGRLRSDIDAVIDLEGTMFGEYTGIENGMPAYLDDAYTVPVLDVNSRAVREEIDAQTAANPGYIYANDHLAQHALDYREVIFEDAGHLNFTDLPLIAPALGNLLGVGTVDAKACMENVNAVVLTFFNAHLKGVGSADAIAAQY